MLQFLILILLRARKTNNWIVFNVPYTPKWILKNEFYRCKKYYNQSNSTNQITIIIVIITIWVISQEALCWNSIHWLSTLTGSIIINLLSTTTMNQWPRANCVSEGLTPRPYTVTGSRDKHSNQWTVVITLFALGEAILCQHLKIAYRINKCIIYNLKKTYLLLLFITHIASEQLSLECYFREVYLWSDSSS